ncbi:MAG: hypothetical protein ABSC94_31330, partial [Polyangiaceae bacterium]
MWSNWFAVAVTTDAPKTLYVTAAVPRLLVGRRALDRLLAQYGRTTRWETLAAGRGWWRGHVGIAHDPALE